MEENNNTTQQKEPKQMPMSPFCEALMETTKPLKDLMQPADVAIIICSDGKIVSSRTGGKMEDAIKMLYSKMVDSPAFRHVIMSASIIFTARRTENAAEKIMATENVKPSNSLEYDN